MDKTHTTGDLKLVRKLNKSIVFNFIKDHGPVSRAEIAKQTSLNKATVSSLVEELIRENFVREIGTGKSSGGRRPVLLLFNGDAGSVIGVDLGVHYISILLTNLNSEVLWSKETAVSPGESPEEIIDTLVSLIQQAVQLAPQTTHGILGIGVGVPGIVDYKNGSVLLAPNLNWRKTPLKRILEEHTELPVYIDNEANMAALGEKMFGAGAGYDHMAYISSGIGIGVGLILNDELYRGAIGYAGEMGHMTIERNGLKCPCGNRGCWEMYASEKAFYMRMKEDYRLADVSRTSFYDYVNEANRGNDRVIANLNETGEYLGIGVANIVNTFNPNLVVIGNTLAAGGKWIFNPIEKTLATRALHFSTEHVKVVQSQLGDRACAIGSVSSILQNLFAVSDRPSPLPY